MCGESNYPETLHHTLWYPRYHRSLCPSELVFSLLHEKFRDVSLDEEIGLQSESSHEWPHAELGINDPVRLTFVLCPALHARLSRSNALVGTLCGSLVGGQDRF
jgi:hypothetical protein